MKNKILKVMALGSAAITSMFLIKYNLFKSWMTKKNKNLNFNDKKHKKKPSSQKTNDTICPPLYDRQWQKIGKVHSMFIYPVKSSEKAILYHSYHFFDYGMCYQHSDTYIYDGMFIVYNGTKGKFEDARRYPLLQNMVTIVPELQENAKVILSDETMESRKNVDIHHNRYPSKRFRKETWSGDFDTFYDSKSQVNTWVKNMIDAASINQTDEDIILTQMIPNNFKSTQKIRVNWGRFVQECKTMEEDDTGKLITLPRFILMTLKTATKLCDITTKIAPNVIINTDELMNTFEEKDWNWIKIGENVILKNVKPVSSGLNKEIEHRGIYCGLWSGGCVSKNDDVFIYSSNSSPKTKLKLPRI